MVGAIGGSPNPGRWGKESRKSVVVRKRPSGEGEVASDESTQATRGSVKMDGMGWVGM